MSTAGSQDMDALRAAVYLFHLQTGVRAAREQPLPGGLSLVLEVAAGETAATEAAAGRLERPAGVVRQAAEFYLEHVVLIPDADAFRTLAAARAASDQELRRNMAMLLRWAHPDVDPNGERAVFAGRVTRAWEALKTPERRAAYEAANPPKAQKRSGGTSSGKARSMRAGAGASPGVGLKSSAGGAAESGAPGKGAKKHSRARVLIGQALRFLVGARRTQR